MGNGFHQSHLVCIIVACTLCALSSAVFADIYKYTDNKGVVNMTDDIKSVPERYRAKMKVIKEEPKPQQSNPVWTENNSPPNVPAGNHRSTEGEQDTEPTTRLGVLFAKYKWLKPLSIIFGLIAAFGAVIKISSLVSSPQLAKIIYTAFFLGTFVFMYTLYSRYIVSGYFMIKERAVEVFKKANVREIPNQSKENIENTSPAVK